MPPASHDLSTLTTREKQTLRLILDGYDAKSAARQLGLSVHTVNERLRDARRKLSVSSSKEAARLLRQAEGTPEIPGDKHFGDATRFSPRHTHQQPGIEAWSRRPAAWAIGGFAMLIATAALIALIAPAGPFGQPSALSAPQASDAASPKAAAVVAAARGWLELGDAARWDEALAATGSSFRTANTPQLFRQVSEQVRAPLGRVISRTLVTQQEVPTPPNGGWTVRFRTDFAARKGAVETLSLMPEDGTWKVVGIYLD